MDAKTKNFMIDDGDDQDTDTGVLTEKAARRAWKYRDVQIEHTGTKITLPDDPAPMPLRTAISALERLAKDEETELNVFEIIDAYPEDALVALDAAMRQKYGWASPIVKIVETMFGKQKIKPTLVTVQTGAKPGESVQVLYGQFILPGVENPIETIKHVNENGPCLVITGTVRKREERIVKELAELTRQILKERSIYKGQAIRLRADTHGNLDINRPPEFIDTDPIRPQDLILNADEYDQVVAALWTPIQHTDQCIEHGIPLNRGVLFEGIYGTGKTMTAAVTSKVCVEHQWTYILLDDVRALKEALMFAQRYAPAVVFAEDIDRVIAQRDQVGNDILNTIDGVLSKNSQVITVLTTNHVELLDKAMLRPGRLDAIISIKAPDQEAVQRLLRLYGREMIRPDEPLGEVSIELAGNIPATIREVVERSKLAMIAHDRNVVTEEDLLIATRGMAHHLDLLRDNPVEPSLEEQVGDRLGRLVAERSRASLDDAIADEDGLVDKVKEIHEATV